MPAHLSTRFIRIQSNLINIEAIQRVHLNKDGSAVLLLNGTRKALQRVEVPAPHGSQIFDFVKLHLVIMEFGELPPPVPTKKDKPRKKKT